MKVKDPLISKAGFLHKNLGHNINPEIYHITYSMYSCKFHATMPKYVTKTNTNNNISVDHTNEKCLQTGS